MNIIRYSKGFKMQLVRKVETGQWSAYALQPRCNIQDRQTVDLELVLALVRAERAQQSRLGVRKLYYLIGPELKAAGVKMGRDRLFAELSKVGLLVEPKPAEWPRTTHFNANLPVFKNLI